MQQVLVFAGNMQSGKSSSAKYVTGHKLQQSGLTNWFDISPEGDLLIEAKKDDGTTVKNAVLDLNRDDFEFFQYAHENIWSKVKIYSFARELKESAITLFGLDRSKVYGSNEDKGSSSPVRWNDVLKTLDSKRKQEIKQKYKDVLPEFLTNREVLQEFGSLCRLIQPNCWVDACWRNIKQEGYPFAIIDDCRYENEVIVSRNNGAKIILLTAKKFDDTHNSEKILDVDRTLFDFVIDNQDFTLQQKHQELDKILSSIDSNKAML